MFTLILCFIFILFDTSYGASFNCEYKTEVWNVPGSAYNCKVINSVNITSFDEAFIDSVKGTHQTGYNNDKVETFQVKQGTIHYFPRGLEIFFKNLKGILISNSGLKEVHQTDLKPFPELRGIWLYYTQIEILEEGLFDSNPNLEHIYLSDNKIFHINPKIFDNLTKLKWLYILQNLCINMKAENNATAMQNVIKSTKMKCNDLNYSFFEEKIKNLEIESKNFDLETFNEKFQNLENEVNSSRFYKFFTQRLQNLRRAKMENSPETSTKIPKTTTKRVKNDTEKDQNEACPDLKSKFTNFATSLKELLDKIPNEVNDSVKNNKTEQIVNLNEKCLAFNESFTNFNENFSNLNESIKSFNEYFNKKVLNLGENVAKLDENLSAYSESTTSRLETLEENLNNFKTFSYEKSNKIETEVKAAQYSIVKTTNKGFDRIEKRIVEMEEKFAKIMKTLNIEE